MNRWVHLHQGVTARLHRDVHRNSTARPLSQRLVAVVVENKLLDAGLFHRVLSSSFARATNARDANGRPGR